MKQLAKIAQIKTPKAPKTMGQQTIQTAMPLPVKTPKLTPPKLSKGAAKPPKAPKFPQ